MNARFLQITQLIHVTTMTDRYRSPPETKDARPSISTSGGFGNIGGGGPGTISSLSVTAHVLVSSGSLSFTAGSSSYGSSHSHSFSIGGRFPFP